MHNVAVKMWDKMSNKPAVMPDAWPAEVLEPAPAELSADFVTMTCSEYRAYRAAHQADYDAIKVDLPQE